MANRAAVALVVGVMSVALVGTGCQNNKNGKVGYAQDGKKVEEPEDDFGTKKEPPIAAKTRLAAAQVAESRGDVASAIDQYEKALASDPKLTAAWYGLGVTSAQARQFDKSLNAWKHYVTLVKDDPAAYANLGFTYDLSGQFDKAQATYLEGIKLNPKHKACRVNYGLMLAKAGRIADARAEFAAVLKPADVHYNLGSIYEQQGKYDQSRVEYETAIELNPYFADAKKRLDGLPKVVKPIAKAE
jgi:tetratricopeptide (TPR) repeat protein